MRELSEIFLFLKIRINRIKRLSGRLWWSHSVHYWLPQKVSEGANRQILLGPFVWGLKRRRIKREGPKIEGTKCAGSKRKGSNDTETCLTIILLRFCLMNLEMETPYYYPPNLYLTPDDNSMVSTVGWREKTFLAKVYWLHVPYSSTHIKNTPLGHVFGIIA